MTIVQSPALRGRRMGEKKRGRRYRGDGRWPKMAAAHTDKKKEGTNQSQEKKPVAEEEIGWKAVPQDRWRWLVSRHLSARKSIADVGGFLSLFIWFPALIGRCTLWPRLFRFWFDSIVVWCAVFRWLLAWRTRCLVFDNLFNLFLFNWHYLFI